MTSLIPLSTCIARFKNVIVCGLFLIIVGNSTEASAQYLICNRSILPITTAIGYRDGGNWVASGWWTIWPEECATALSQINGRRHLYYYAQARNYTYEWSGGPDSASFCVTDAAMDGLPDGDCATKQLFSAIDLGEQPPQTYTTTLQCTTCKLPEFKYDKAAKRVTVYHLIKRSFSGKNIFFPVYGTFDLNIDNVLNVLTASAVLDFDMSDFQKKLPGLVQNQAQTSNDCGDNFSVNSVSVQRAGSNAGVRAATHYEKWLCTYADLPQITCEPTWIVLPGLKTKGIPTCETVCEDTWIEGFGIKTKGLPSCSEECEDTWIETEGVKTNGPPACTNHGMQTVRTSHNKLFSQGGSITITITPSVGLGSAIQFLPEVTDVQLSGLGQTFANLFGINTKKIAQDVLSHSIDPDSMKLITPPEFSKFVTLNDANFYSGSDGSLRMKAQGIFKITGPDAISLCKQYWPEGKCATVQ
jgi:uncharacterized membrane protein